MREPTWEDHPRLEHRHEGNREKPIETRPQKNTIGYVLGSGRGKTSAVQGSLVKGARRIKGSRRKNYQENKGQPLEVRTPSLSNTFRGRKRERGPRAGAAVVVRGGGTVKMKGGARKTRKKPSFPRSQGLGASLTLSDRIREKSRNAATEAQER